jgi:hypothetical protein
MKNAKILVCSCTSESWRLSAVKVACAWPLSMRGSCEMKVTSQYPAHGQGISLSAQGASMATKSSHINRRAKRTKRSAGM